MRTQPERSPDATHRGLAQAGPCCQRATAPMGCSFGSLFQGQAYGPLHAVIADLSRGSGSHLVPQTGEALGDKTIPPHAHRKARGVQPVGHGSVILATDTLPNDAGAKGQGSRTPRLLQQSPQSDLLFWTDNEFSLLRTSSWIGHDPR